MSDTGSILLVASPTMSRTPAFEHAVALARARGAQLCVVMVDFIRSLEVFGLFNREVLTTLRESYLQMHRHWLEQEADYERRNGLDVSIQLLWAKSEFEEISDYVRRVQPWVLIKDVHLESSLKRLFSTPLDWHLLRDCPCPVQLVTESQPVLPRKILAAVNLYRPHHHDVGLNDTILEHASQMAACCNASLHVLYVYDWPAIYAAGPSLLGSLPLEGGFQEALGDAHEESFTRLNERYHIPPGHRHFLTGPPLKTINAFARNNAFDLLVIGSLPHRTVERIMGNTAEHLLNHAPCSVSIVKACK